MAVDKHGNTLTVGDKIRWQRYGFNSHVGYIQSINGGHLQVLKQGRRGGEVQVGANTAERQANEA